MVASDNDERIEITKRIAAANRTYFSLLPVLKSRVICRDTKLRLYKILIRTVVTYGSEAWTLTAASAERLDALRGEYCAKSSDRLGRRKDGGPDITMSY